MLYNGKVQGSDVAAWANSAPMPIGTLRGQNLRIWSDSATTPQEQANIINTIASNSGIALKAEAKSSSKADLLKLLGTPDTVVIVTIGWDTGFTPFLARDGDASAIGTAGWPYSAHALILAAYDPGHKSTIGGSSKTTEWGFVNSWYSGGSSIYWMPDADFDKAWSFNIVPIGSNNIVVVTKK
jgi:hypothetical protein